MPFIQLWYIVIFNHDNHTMVMQGCFFTYTWEEAADKWNEQCEKQNQVVSANIGIANAALINQMAAKGWTLAAHCYGG